MVSAVVLGGLAVCADWTGFGWLSGSASMAAIGAVLLAFLLAHLPVPSGAAATDSNSANMPSSVDHD